MIGLVLDVVAQVFSRHVVDLLCRELSLLVLALAIALFLVSYTST